MTSQFEPPDEMPSRVFELDSRVSEPRLSQEEIDYFTNIADKATRVADVLKYPLEHHGKRLFVSSLSALEEARNPESHSFVSAHRSFIPSFSPRFLSFDSDLHRGLFLIRTKLDEMLVACGMESICHNQRWSKGLIATVMENNFDLSAESQEECRKYQDVLTRAADNIPVVVPTEWAEWLRSGSELIRERLAALSVKPSVTTKDLGEEKAETYTRKEIAEMCDKSESFLRNNRLLGPPQYPGKGRGKPHKWLKDDPTVKALLERYGQRKANHPEKGRQKKQRPAWEL